MLFQLFIAWAVVTVIMVALILYRGMITMREEDQIFLDAAENHLAQEQAEIVAKANRISKPIRGLEWACGLLLLAMAGVWVQSVLKTF